MTTTNGAAPHFTMTEAERAHLVALGETPASIDAMTADKMQSIFDQYGAPAAHTNGNGKPPGPPDDDDLAQTLDALKDAAQVDPLDRMTAAKIADLLPGWADYEGNAAQAIRDALRNLIGYLPAVERAALEGPLLKHLFKAKKDLDAFLSSCPQPPGAPRFTPFTLADLLKRPAKLWLIDQIIGRGDLGAIFGPPGSGKTFVVIDLIFCACLNLQFAQRFDVARPLQVAYTAGEGISGLKARFEAAAHRYNVTDYLPGFTFFELVPQLYQDNGDGISAFVAEWKARQADGGPGLDLLIIDTLHSATVGADENSAQDMGQVLASAKHAIQELGCAVLLVHHSNKAGTGERGSSALRGAMDVMISTQQTAGKFSMSCEKLKDGEAWKPQTFDLVAAGDDCESVRVWWDAPMDGETGDKRKTQTANEILELLNSGETDRKLTAKQIGDALGITPQNVNRVIARLTKEKTVLRHEEQDSRGSWLYSITDEGRQAIKTGPTNDELVKQGL